MSTVRLRLPCGNLAGVQTPCSEPLKVQGSGSWVLMACWEFTWQKGAVCWHGAIGASIGVIPLLFCLEGMCRAGVRATIILCQCRESVLQISLPAAEASPESDQPSESDAEIPLPSGCRRASAAAAKKLPWGLYRRQTTASSHRSTLERGKLQTERTGARAWAWSWVSGR